MMKLSVSDNSNLSFLVAAYDASHSSAKTLSGRLRSLLTKFKETIALETFIEFPGPYLIDRKLKALHVEINDGVRSVFRDSILSVSWLNNVNLNAYKGKRGPLFEGGDITCAGALSFDDLDRDYVESPAEGLQRTGKIANLYTSKKSSDTLYLHGLKSHFNPLHDDDNASVSDNPRQAILRNYRSMSDFNYAQASLEGANNMHSTRSSILESAFDTDGELLSGLTTPSMVVSPVESVQSLGQLCSPDFISKGCTKNSDKGLSEGAISPRENVGETTPQAASSNDDLSEKERHLLSNVCISLRRMLLFLVEESKHELHTNKLFDSTILECIQLLEGVASDSLCMMNSTKDNLRRYTLAYMASLNEYQRASAKLTKLEKCLETAFLGRMSTGGEGADPGSGLECEFNGCYSQDRLFQQHRRSHRGIVKDLLSNPKDFVRYTNYIEQLCLAGYLHDNLIKNREKFTSGLTGVLGTFADHYPATIFEVETTCLDRMASVSSVLLQCTCMKATSLDICLSDAITIPVEGVLDLRFSLNVESISLKERIHSTIVECFEAMRTLAKRLSKFHSSQVERFGRFISRYQCTLCEVDLNKLFKSYQRYHIHMHGIWWGVFSTISTVFPQDTVAFRRFKDFQQPVLGDFREVKLPFNLFDTVLRQFEAVVKISKEYSLAVCSTSLKVCSERQSWATFIYSLASKHHVNPAQLRRVIEQLRGNVNLQPSGGLPFPVDYSGNDNDSSKAGNYEEDLILLKEPIKPCNSSNIVHNMMSVIECMAEAVVDYKEEGYDFSFKRGDTLHVRVAGNTPIWFGHTASGVDRWFPAKFVKLKGDCGIQLFRRADIECDTYLDGFRLSKEYDHHHNKHDAVITLSSKSILKQSLVLSKLGLQGKVEYEFKCAISRKIVLRGTLYLTKTHLGFISSFNDVTLFGSQTTLTVAMNDIVSCELSSNKAVSFYVKIALRNGDVHVLHSVTNARRIRDAIFELAELDEYDSQEIISSDSIDSSVSMESVRKFFGVLEPLSKTAPSVSLQMSLEDFFRKHMSNNIKAGSRIADSRLSQNAFNFDGMLEPVEFDWSRGGVQFHKRNISYNFRLKEGKFTSLIPRHTCGKAREEIKYALVNMTQVIYESTNRVSDIPYGDYFYTIMRVTAAALSSTTTVLKCEYDVKFLKNTVFGSVITAEASDRLLQSLRIISMATQSPLPTTTVQPVVKRQQSAVVETGPTGASIRKGSLRACTRSLLTLCFIVFAIYTSWMSTAD